MQALVQIGPHRVIINADDGGDAARELMTIAESLGAIVVITLPSTPESVAVLRRLLVGGEHIMALSRRLDEFETSVRIHNFFEKHGFVYVWQLVSCNEELLYGLKDFTRKVLKEVEEEILKKMGLKLGMDLGSIEFLLPKP